MLDRRTAIALGLAGGMGRFGFSQNVLPSAQPDLSDSVEDAAAVQSDAYDPVPLPGPTESMWRFGLKFSTPISVTNLLATYAVPRDWPEQTAEVVSRSLDAPLRASVRDLPHDCARQVLITAPRVNAGATLDAFVEMRITKHHLGVPKQTEGLTIPKRMDRDLRMFVGNSPNINASHGLIRKASRALDDDAPESAWKRVEAIYDFVREKVKYVEGPIRNASDALVDGKGDCEDMTSLFVAFCRNAKVPARMVWVPGHCYPEFYLLDPNENGHWFPCQVAGTRAFGEMPEDRPILQKGDKFKVPESVSPKRYLSTTFRCDRRSKGNPRPVFLMEPITG